MVQNRLSVSVTAVQTGSDSALGNQPSYLDITGLSLDVVAGSPIDITAQVSDDRCVKHPLYGNC
jgi:hypothetical protein